MQYSNEVWNSLFDAHDYAVQQGLARGLATDGPTAGIRYHALRSNEAFDIIRNEFGASQRSRLVHVLSTWAFPCGPYPTGTGCGWSYTTQLLEYSNRTAPSPGHVDALGVTAYFCDGEFAQAATMTAVSARERRCVVGVTLAAGDCACVRSAGRRPSRCRRSS